MALVESENLIVQYIEDNDCKVSKNSVVRYMDESVKVKPHFRLAKVAVYKAIDRLIEAKRIKICSEGRRQGQTHYLGINRESEFDKVIANISKINNDFGRLQSHNPTRIKSIPVAIKVYDEEWTPSIKFLEEELKILLFTIRKKINTETELKMCYDKILESMTDLSEKEYKVKRTMEKLRRFQFSR